MQPTIEKIKCVYISGSISKRERSVALAHFKKAQDNLENADVYVYNPMEFNERDCWEDYMRDGLAALVDSDEILMLDGWQESRGACFERLVAFELNIPIKYEHEMPWDSSAN
jgi:hypothetical protein